VTDDYFNAQAAMPTSEEEDDIDPVSGCRLNITPPNDQLPLGLDHLKSLEKGFPRGAGVVLTVGRGSRHRDWEAALRRIAAEGSPVVAPLGGIPSCCTILKGRPADKIGRFGVDYSAELPLIPIELTPIDWEPPSIQVVGRVGRRVNSNAGLPKRTASRNQREGVYGFKVDGRHTRKKTKPKVEVVALDSASAASKIRASKLANVDQKQHVEP
jgi:hypothetical protein